MKRLAAAIVVSVAMWAPATVGNAQGTEGKPITAYEGPALSKAQMRDAVAHIEQHIKLPEGSEGLGNFVRYYAQDKGIVYAVFVTPFGGDRSKLGTYIVPYKELPIIFDGGCSVIDVTFVPKSKALRANCHGVI